MNKYFKHLKTILRHKWYVGIECFKRGLYWQGLVHDLSKFSLVEFASSAKYFNGIKSPIDIEKDKLGYSVAWLNHKAKNKHHWQYWTDFEDGKIITVPIPKKYILEMVCDFIGAGKAYNKNNYNPSEPLEYFKKVLHTWYIHPESIALFEKELLKIAQSEITSGIKNLINKR